MIELKNILYKVKLNAVSGSTCIEINNIHFDSRSIVSKDVFVAIKGNTVDGHDYINTAINQGAIAVICEKIPDIIKDSITYVEVDCSSSALAIMASNYYNNPSENLKLVGVTGTNGKTTVATLLYQLFKKAGYKVGLLSTVKIVIDNIEFQTTHTTPDSLIINKYLSEMNAAGVEYCFMEVSSHGIHQNRTEGLHFEGGIFTNLSHDHLDYHKTIEDYFHAKSKLFKMLPIASTAIIIINDIPFFIVLSFYY